VAASPSTGSSHRRRRATDALNLHLFDAQEFSPPHSPSAPSASSAATAGPASSPSGAGSERAGEPVDPWEVHTEDEARAFGSLLDAELEEESNQPLMPSCVGSRKGYGKKVERVRRTDAKKGIKLDFKQLACVEPAIDFLRRSQAAQRLGGHLWLNADVFAGPGALVSPLDAQKFVRLCAESIPQAVLSLGWGSTILSTTRTYTHEMIDRMIELCMYPIVKPSLPDPDMAGPSEGLTIPPAAASLHITFAVSAEYALSSADNLRRLLDTVPSTSLTIYSGVGSLGVTSATAQEFLRAFGKGRCFFDLKVTKPWRSYFWGQARNCGGASPKAVPTTPRQPGPGGEPSAFRGSIGPPSEALPPKGPRTPPAQPAGGLISIV